MITMQFRVSHDMLTLTLLQNKIFKFKCTEYKIFSTKENFNEIFTCFTCLCPLHLYLIWVLRFEIFLPHGIYVQYHYSLKQLLATLLLRFADTFTFGTSYEHMIQVAISMCRLPSCMLFCSFPPSVIIFPL